MEMSSRQKLQSKFEELLGSRNVYYQPPNNLVMQYDAIRYSRSTDQVKNANNVKYLKMKSYDGIVISRKPDPEVVDKISDLPYTSFGSPYVVDNLYHYPFTIYY